MSGGMEEFARFLAGTNAVKFGDFTLKSGKKSNIFFDFGRLVYGEEMYSLGGYFADFIMKNSLEKAEVLFGPAYKGINISIATSIALAQKYQVSIPFAYNRKVEKDHAEGGKFVGYDLSKASSAVVLDDVFTNGGTKYEVIDMLRAFKNLEILAFIVGVDRQETDEAGLNCRAEFERRTGLKVLSLATRAEVLEHKK